MAADSQAGDDLRERSIPDLVKQLADQTSTLVRQEVDLAKAEVTQKREQMSKGAGLVGAGAVVGLLAAGALTAFLIMLLDGVLANWLAALVVAVALGVIAAVLSMQGRNRIRAAAPPMPEQTVDTVKEDVAWAKTQAGSARR